MSLTASEVHTVIAGAMLALFLAALDQTIVATALPSIAGDLGGFSLISWVVSAYLLTSVCATPIFGKLSDIHGRRPVLTACLTIFMAGSALCALAPDMISLIMARAIQGIGGGGLITLAQTIIADVVSPRERGRYSAYFAGVWAASALLGPSLGGMLTEHAGWSWIFWINVPLSLLSLRITSQALRKLPVNYRAARIDYPGIVLLSLGTIALLLVLSLGGKHMAWTAPPVIVLALVALGCKALFIWHQRRVAEPILPRRFMTDRVVGPILSAMFLVFGGYLSIAVLAPVYFQVALGVTVSQSGLLMIPIMLSTTITAAMAGRYNKVTGRYRLPPLIGLPVAILGLAGLSGVAGNVSAPAAATMLMLAGFGIGPIFPCSIVAAQNAVEPRDLGAVNGAISFSRALGGAIATAAAAALVLGLAAAALPDMGAVTSLEDLARTALPPEARASLVDAFAILFQALAMTLALGMLVFARVEDRPLRERPGMAQLQEGDNA